MPWLLTTALNTGDLDSGTYAEVKITNMTHRPNQNLIMVELEYGNTVNSDWAPGHLPAGKSGSHIIEGQKYTDLVTTHASLNGELTYIAAKRALYEHLETEGVIDAGSVT